jgi:hypothetical protein
MSFRFLKIEEIQGDPDIQIRDSLDEERVEEYAAAMLEGAQFPRLVVFFDRLHYWLASGYHRYEAAHRAGRREIDCDVRDGAKRDAIIFALSDNKHGLSLSRDEKRRAVERLVADAEWSKATDVAIAKHIGVSREFVNRVRHGDRAESVTKSHSQDTSVSGQSVTKSHSDDAGERNPITPSAVKNTERVESDSTDRSPAEPGAVDGDDRSAESGSADEEEFEAYLNGLHTQIDELQRKNDALMAGDRADELMKQMQLLLNAENQLKTERERSDVREKQLKWFGRQYAELRELLGVKNDRDVMARVRELVKETAQ